MLLRKYLGDTSQLTKAIFTAASKMEPCIVFIDEMDSMFRSRTDGDNHYERNLLTECKMKKQSYIILVIISLILFLLGVAFLPYWSFLFFFHFDTVLLLLYPPLSCPILIYSFYTSPPSNSSLPSSSLLSTSYFTSLIHLSSPLLSFPLLLSYDVVGCSHCLLRLHYHYWCRG